MYRRFKSLGIDIKSSFKENGYHFQWRNIPYTVDFVYENNKIFFVLDANVSKENNDLESRIRRRMISNKIINKTKYLSGQNLQVSGKKVNLRCRLKRPPKEDAEINVLCDSIWGNLAKNIMKGIYGE